MGSLGDVIYFGFGATHLIRDLTTTEEGGCLVAICAAPSPCYHEDVAADILHEMALFHKIPNRLAPSILQWKNLLHSCEGAFASTFFPLRAEYLMQLHSRSNRLSGDPDAHTDLRGCASPETLAEALIAIGKVSTGELLSLTIMGGAAAEWLAAIAEWLFDLNVIVLGADGDLSYRNCSAEDVSHVQVIYRDEDFDQ